MKGCRASLVALILAASLGRAAEKPVLILDPGGHVTAFRGLAFTPDGSELISRSNQPDFTIRFWNVKTGELNRVLRLPTFFNGGSVMALSPNGEWLALSLANPQKEVGLAMISLRDGKMRHVLTGQQHYLSGLEFSPDGRRLAAASADGTVHIYHPDNLRHLQTMNGHRGGIDGLAFSPDGSRLVTASVDLTCRIWDVASGQELHTLADPDLRTGNWSGVAWSPDGKTIVNGCLGSALRIWNADGTLRGRITDILPYRSMVFSKDSRCILFAATGGGYLYDLERKEMRAACKFPAEEWWRVALSPDNRVAATGGANGEDLYLWDTSTGKVLYRLAGQGRTPYGVAWSPDGTSVAWGINTGGSVGWGNGGPLHLNHPLERSFDVTTLQFGPPPEGDWRGRLTTTGGLKVSTVYEGGFTRGWVQVKEGDTALTTIKQQWSSFFTFLPGDKIALSGGFAGVQLYDARTGQHLKTFKGAGGRSLALSADGRYLLGAQADQSLRIWSIDREEFLLSLFFAGSEWIAWTPEGYYAASPGGEKLMGWQIHHGPDRLATFYPAAQFRKTLYRPDVIKLVLKTGSVEKALEMADSAVGRTSNQAVVESVLPPTVRITSPSQTTIVRDVTLEVVARASSVGQYPVASLQLLLDGRPVVPGGLFRVEAPKLGDVQTSWNIALTPGKHRLSVRAESAVSSALSEDVEVHHMAADPAEQGKLPTLYLLAVGISDYPGDLKLNYAARDAEILASTLQEHSKPLFEKVVVKTLTNQRASQREVMQGISWLKKQPTQRDIAILFFAGHGELASDGSMYLLPADVDPNDLEATGVPADQVKTLLTGFPCRVILMLDACHAGGIDSKTKKRGGKSLTDDLIRDLVADERGVIALCASTGKQFALESNEHRHGLFTLALVEGLKGKATKTAEGAVYLHHLDAYVTDRVKELSQGRQSPTTARPACIRSFPLSKP